MSDRHESLEERFERWYSEPDPGQALTEVRALLATPGAVEDEDERYDLAAFEVTLLHELGQWQEVVERASPFRDEDGSLAYREANARLMLWEIDTACDLLEDLEGDLDPFPPLEAARLADLALVRDLEGNTAAADALMHRAAELDPDGYRDPLRMSAEQAHALLDEVAATLPDPVRAVLENVVIEIVPMPNPRLVAGSDTTPELLGLYLGNSLLESDAMHGAPELPRVQVYQRNLERIAYDEEELREELRTTLLHEIGHHLGFDEEGLDDLGLA